MGTPSVTVYVDYKETPHTFIKLDDGNGTVKYYGFGPAESGSSGILTPAAGKVGDLGVTTHELGKDLHNDYAGYMDDVCWGKTISLTQDQFSAMKNTAQEWKSDPPNYNVFGTNCTAFVKAVLASGNASYPGISSGPNPMNLIPVEEQGAITTTNAFGGIEFSDAVGDPLNTPGTPAYEDRQLHPERYPQTGSTSSDDFSYIYQQKQNVDGTTSVSIVEQLGFGTEDTLTDTNGDGTYDTNTLQIGNTTYNLRDPSQRQDAEYQLDNLHDSGLLSDSFWNGFTQDSVSQLIDGGSGLPTSWQDPFDLGFDDPIGAFYDSQSSAYDNSASIARHTPVALDADNNKVSAAELQALDANGDGQVDTTESGQLRFWQDLNENGHLESGERIAIDHTLKQADYAFYTQGNGQLGNGQNAAPSVGAIAPPGNTPNSNYRTLRDTDNRYIIPGYGVSWITWTSSQVKINYNNKSYLIGTDGNDSFDSNYYAAYPTYFNSNLLTNFLGGGGDDWVGGSIRDDKIWSGAGNDLLFGDVGNDLLNGSAVNDAMWEKAA